MKGERGFALVITLVVTTLLVALLAEFVSEVYVDTSHSKNFVASQQAAILAESGVAGGVKLLQLSATMRKGEYSSLSELWAKPQIYDSGAGTVSIAIEEESGKLDLNSATSQTGEPSDFHRQTLARLFANLKVAPELYDAIADWADTNQIPRPNGAETSYYRTLKPPYQAHNHRFDTLEELALVKGVTPEAMAKLRGCLTVYGSVSGVAAPININTAPKELLAALDEKLMRGDLVERILEQRKKRPIKTLAEVDGMDTVLQQSLALKVVCKGATYRIRAEGKVGESVRVAEAVVTDVEQQKPTVLYWREY